MKKILFLFLFLFFSSSFFVYAEFGSVDLPSPGQFNSALKNKYPLTYYWDYSKYTPKSIVVLRHNIDGSISYCPTLSSKIILDFKKLLVDEPNRFYLFSYKNGNLSPSGGSTSFFDLKNFDILYLSNGFTPSGVPLDNLGNESGNDGGSWENGISFDIEDGIPNFDFDNNNENQNNSFFSSLVNYIKEIIGSLKKYFIYTSKVFDKLLSFSSDIYKFLKDFTKFFYEFLKDNNFGDWFVSVFKKIFFVPDGYFEEKFDFIKRELLVEKFHFHPDVVIFNTLKYMKSKPFDDYKVSIRVLGNSFDIVVFKADTLNNAANFFRPFLSWFLNFMLGLYHFDQIYFLIRGTKYFNGKHFFETVRR